MIELFKDIWDIGDVFWLFLKIIFNENCFWFICVLNCESLKIYVIRLNLELE